VFFSFIGFDCVSTLAEEVRQDCNGLVCLAT
jgi:amino acid transporter